MRLLPRSLVAVACATVLSAQHDGVAVPSAPPASIDFARDVRPILAQHCYNCHGPDDGKRKADLRLDRKAEAFAARDAGAAFVAGQPEQSDAFVRVTTDDPELRMPPPDAGDGLKPAEIEVLRRWLAAGAPWQEHWAFVAPVRPAVPTPTDAAWAKNEIDHFVRLRLQQEGLAPSAEASREAWLRRVGFDLIGLPPTPAELDAFLADQGSDAYERVVDRLLADPRYGERQATEWLDLARYADSSGYQRDTARQAWKWRDWVIDACNQNQPFDRFTIEQLAGDLLPQPTLGQRIATGFNRNHPVNTEAGEELDEYRSAYVIDRVHTTATTWLGLSVGCAQCHDHKYDPISQREFYGFYDFFNHVKEKDNGFGRNPKPAIAAPGPEDEAKLAELERRIRTLKRRLDRVDPLTDAVQAEWEAGMLARIGAPLPWTTLVATERMAKHGSRLQQLEDGSVLASGPSPARDTYELVFTPGKRTIHALRLEVLPDPSLPHGASGRADDGRFILDRLEASLASVADSSDAPPIVWALAQADIEQDRDEDEHYLTAIEPGSIAESVGLPDAGGGGGGFGGFRFGSGWSVAGDERKEPREAVLIPLEPLVCNETTLLRLSLRHDGSGKFKSTIGRFRVSIGEDPRVRTLLLPVQPTPWQALGPFAAADVDAAHATAFAPEADFATAQWKKKYDPPVVPPPAAKDGAAATAEAGAAQAGTEPAESGEATAGKAARAAAGQPAEAKPAAAKPAGLLAALGELFTAAAKPAAGAAGAQAGGAAGKPKGKPAAPEAAPSDADEEAATGEADDDTPVKSKRKPRLAWVEHRDWREGGDASLPIEGQAVAWYVARKLTTATARTVMVELDGGAAAKVWLNGNLVGDFDPVAAAPAPKPKPKPKPVPEADEDSFVFTGMTGPERDPRRLQLGLRSGENHLVIKLVGKGKEAPKPAAGKPGAAAAAMAMEPELPPGVDPDDLPPQVLAKLGRGGGRDRGLTFRCTLQAEGDDRIDYATMQGLLARQQPAAAAPPVGVAEASLQTAPPPAELAAALRTADDEQPKAKTSRERRERGIRRWFRTRIDVAGRALAAELAKQQRDKDRFEAKLPSALVMEELKERRPTHLFVRGDYRKKGELVTAHTPAALPPMAADLPKNRLGLAQWLVAGEHPLTARVWVNRAWQQFFGHGLVRTADDFGIRGLPPSHPELLDWLATEFVRRQWDRKAMHRLLVLSATYRQRSAVTPELLARDPENVLLARGPAQRLTAEMLRDQALSTSGLLVQKVGGPSVKPFQPKGLWQSMLGGSEWRNDPPEQANRRGLYVYWKRGVPYPSATIFDASKRETCTVTRARTTTPLQALVTLNDPVFVEAGKALGVLLRRDGGDTDDARLTHGFRLVASRAPDARELTILRELLADQRAHYQQHPELAKLRVGLKPTKGKGKGQGKSQSKAGPADAGATAADAAAKAGAGQSVMGQPATGQSATGQPVAKGGPGAAAPTPEAAKPPPPPGAKPPKFDPTADPAEAAAWAQLGSTLLNLDAAIRRG
jgi:hypothetical protein